ncbi:MAG: alpha-1,2-fucosyltransferase [Chitinophagaceae bacterium]
MVIVQLLGGMGNQMFQYALGKHLALLNRAELKLDTSILLNWTPGKHAVNRGFDLDIFNLSPVFASKKEIKKYHTDGFPVLDKVFFKLREKLQGNRMTKEKHFHFDPAVLQAGGDLYLAGTWQSYKYFEAIEEEIRKDFAFSLPLSPAAEALKQQLVQTNSVCLNVRRTDYVSVAATSSIMAPVGIGYYKKALRKMQELQGDFSVFVFSDDIEWCRTNLAFIEQPVTFVDHSYAGRKFSDYLQLMAACKHYIIPNSTFAWWGAWLNGSSSKTVIAPVEWFNDPSVSSADLIPSSWIRL